MNNLKPGQTYEIKEAYIGKNQKTIHTCNYLSFNETNRYRNVEKQSYTESKKGITFSEKE